MPQIHEYTAPEGLGLRPTETGIEATAGAARRVGAAYSEIAQVTKEAGSLIGSGIAFAGQQAVEYLERKEISQGAAAFAGLMNSKTKQWQETNTNADPNDPTVAKNFQDSVAADLEKFQSGFLTRKGQAWAEAHVQTAQNHFFHASSADRANAAGHAVKINAERTVEGNANSAYWAGGTKESVDQAIQNMRTSGFHPDIINDGVKKIITQGALGYIEKNAAVPDWAKGKGYSEYLDAAKLQHAAEQREKFNDGVAKRQTQQQEHAVRADFNDQLSKIYRDTLPVNNSSRPQLPPDFDERMDKLRTHPAMATPAAAREYNSAVKHGNTIANALNKPEPLVTTSHRATVGLIGRIRSGDITEQGQIDDVYGSGTLTSADYNFARKEFYDRKTDDGITLSHARGDFWKRAERSIDPGMTALGERTALGDQQVHKAMMAARQQEETLRAKGLNPQLTYDERSEYFFGKPENLRQYAVSLQQTNDYNAAIRRGDVPQTPGAPVAPTPAIPRPNVGPVQPSLRPGDVYRGNEYLGGPKDDPASWRRVGAPSAPLSR